MPQLWRVRSEKNLKPLRTVCSEVREGVWVSEGRSGKETGPGPESVITEIGQTGN